MNDWGGQEPGDEVIKVQVKALALTSGHEDGGLLWLSGTDKAPA